MHLLHSIRHITNTFQTLLNIFSKHLKLLLYVGYVMRFYLRIFVITIWVCIVYINACKISKQSPCITEITKPFSSSPSAYAHKASALFLFTFYKTWLNLCINWNLVYLNVIVKVIFSHNSYNGILTTDEFNLISMNRCGYVLFTLLSCNCFKRWAISWLTFRSEVFLTFSN